MSKAVQSVNIPMRMCIVTRERKPKKELVRFVLDRESGIVSLDPKGKVSGRGANISQSLDIFDQAVKTGAFSRAFKSPVSKENLQAMREQLAQYLARKELGEQNGKVVVRIQGKI